MLARLRSYLWALSLVGPLFLLSKNWDGYGADKGKISALIASILLLEKFRTGCKIKTPEVHLTRDGCVEMIWETDKLFLDIIVEDFRSLAYIWVDSDKDGFESGVLRGREITGLTQAIASD